MNIKSTAEKLQALINSQSRSPTLEAIEAVLREGEEWFDLTDALVGVETIWAEAHDDPGEAQNEVHRRVTRMVGCLRTDKKARIADLEAALAAITKHAVQADDPEHHTLGLIKHMAADALRPATED